MKKLLIPFILVCTCGATPTEVHPPLEVAILKDGEILGAWSGIPKLPFNIISKPTTCYIDWNEAKLGYYLQCGSTKFETSICKDIFDKQSKKAVQLTAFSKADPTKQETIIVVYSCLPSPLT